MRKAVVTGPTGEVGVALVQELLDSGIDVIAVIRPGSNRRDRLQSSVCSAGCKSQYSIDSDVDFANVEENACAPKGTLRVVECALDDLTSLPDIIGEKCDTMYHLGWDYSRAHNDTKRQYANIGYTLDAVNAAQNLGCDTFIGAGSQAEYGPTDELIDATTPEKPVTAYGMAKLAAGQMSRLLCSQLGIKHIWPRIFSVYGPCDAESTMIISVIRQLLAGEKPSLSGGDQLWDFLYTADCAKAMRLVGEKGHDGVIYPIAAGEIRLLREYIEILRDEIDPDLPLGFGEIPYKKGQVMRLEVDVSKLRDEIGFKPEIDFRTGIRGTIEWCRNNPVVLKPEEEGNI